HLVGNGGGIRTEHRKGAKFCDGTSLVEKGGKPVSRRTVVLVPVRTGSDHDEERAVECEGDEQQGIRSFPRERPRFLRQVPGISRRRREAHVLEEGKRLSGRVDEPAVRQRDG